jgi:hypothetical protein
MTVLESISVYSFVLIPISIGVAILHYRLYEIDVIINRALVYGLLSFTLALVYSLGVFVAGELVRAVSSQESNNAAVAVSTLAVAALFGPLRTRLQSFIDKRFYRRKYDAQQILAEFSATLRDQVDLEALGAEVAGVVSRTMQPSYISLWLRPAD